MLFVTDGATHLKKKKKKITQIVTPQAIDMSKKLNDWLSHNRLRLYSIINHNVYMLWIMICFYHLLFHEEHYILNIIQYLQTFPNTQSNKVQHSKYR